MNPGFFALTTKGHYMKSLIFRTLLFLFTQCCGSFALEHTIFETPDAASKIAAEKIVEIITSNQEKGAVLGLATGGTMEPVYQALVQLILERQIDLSNVITFNLDEYLDLSVDDPQSYHSFMYQHLFREILYSDNNPHGIKQENIHFPSPENVDSYDSLIVQYGGIDLQLLGIGRNGHIGFSEPGTPFHSKTMIISLQESTRQDNARFFDGNLDIVPKEAVTMGINTILSAKQILLLAFGESKAEAMMHTITGPITEDVPATALREHINTHIFLDPPAASKLSDHAVYQFTNAQLVIDGSLTKGDLWISNGKIVPPQSQADQVIDLKENIIAPGFIDLQINGAFGCDFTRNPENVEIIAQQLVQYGITGFLPTLVSSDPSYYQHAIPLLQPRICSHGATILGIHLEGPYFSAVYHAAHDISQLKTSFSGEPKEIYGSLQGVKIVTLAPEIPGGLDLVKKLSELGIIVSIGHSSASYEESVAAIKSGASFTTHLFNAMTPFHHRNTGIIGAVLVDQLVPYSLIVDGFHLSPETVQLCWRCSPEGIILVSDATEALGLPDGIYQLGSMATQVHGEQIYIAGTNTIAGSNISINKTIKNLRKFTDCSIPAAIEAASTKPAKLIGVYPQKGSLNSGSDADFVILSQDLDVLATYVRGVKLWERD